MSYTNAVLGTAGFIVGALTPPVAMTLGEAAGELVADNTGLRQEKRHLARTSGEVIAATLLTGLVSLEAASIFNTGMRTSVKILTSVLSSFAGLNTGYSIAGAARGDRSISDKTNPLLDIFILIGSIFLSMLSAQFVHPLIGPFVGAASSGILSFANGMILV